MKIDGLTPAGKSGETPKKTDANVTGPSFGSFLKSAMDAAKAEKGQVPLSPPVLAPGTTSFTAANPFANQAVSQVESALGDLSLYQNILSNTAVPQGRLISLSNSLMDKKDRMVALMPHLDDPRLKEIVSQTASLIVTENSRLNANL